MAKQVILFLIWQLASMVQGQAAPSLGKWDPPIDLKLVAAAAFIVPETGKVVAFAASARTDFLAKGNTFTVSYDPVTGDITERDVRETGHDMFCPGLSLDFNGRAIVTGGNDNLPTTIYEPATDDWTKAVDMNIKRGYQSQTTLSNGKTFMIGGSWTPPEDRGGKEGEIFDPATGKWTVLADCPVAPMLTNDTEGVFRADNHAWLFAWKDAAVFQAGPSKAMNWYGTGGTGSTNAAGLRADDEDSMCGVAVMFDAANGKIFTAGGSPDYENSEATSNAHLITIGNSGTAPTVLKLTSMTSARAFANGVVLPDGKVFVTGGQSFAKTFTDTTAIFEPELWDPETEKFTILPPHKTPRTYHSIAILLLDGRVFTGGGGLCGAECNTNHLDAEIYSPGYLFNSDGTAATRPVINTISAGTIVLGTTINVVTDSPATKFSFMRYGSTTHTVNTDQRRLPLEFKETAANTYDVVIPGDAGIALPGFWMIFAINAAGVPSIAKTVKLTL